MALKIPPPPPIASQDPAFNRWLLELTSILSDSGGIDPEQVAGLRAVYTQVTANTAAIATLGGTVGGISATIASLQHSVATLSGNIATINGQITTLNASVAALQARAQVLNGATAPAAGLGNVGDWYADTVAKHVYVKTGAATWTLIV